MLRHTFLPLNRRRQFRLRHLVFNQQLHCTYLLRRTTPTLAGHCPGSIGSVRVLEIMTIAPRLTDRGQAHRGNVLAQETLAAVHFARRRELRQELLLVSPVNGHALVTVTLIKMWPRQIKTMRQDLPPCPHLLHHLFQYQRYLWNLSQW